MIPQVTKVSYMCVCYAISYHYNISFSFPADERLITSPIRCFFAILIPVVISYKALKKRSLDLTGAIFGIKHFTKAFKITCSPEITPLNLNFYFIPQLS